MRSSLAERAFGSVVTALLLLGPGACRDDKPAPINPTPRRAPVAARADAAAQAAAAAPGPGRYRRHRRGTAGAPSDAADAPSGDTVVGDAGDAWSAKAA